MGKSTYVNRLALDWANGLEHATHFDVVLLIKMAELEQNQDGSSEQFFVDNVATITVSSVATAEIIRSVKTLLILDGYDENPKQQLVETLANNRKLKARILITCRGSHMEELKDVRDMWIRWLL